MDMRIVLQTDGIQAILLTFDYMYIHFSSYIELSFALKNSYFLTKKSLFSSTYLTISAELHVYAVDFVYCE